MNKRPSLTSDLSVDVEDDFVSLLEVAGDERRRSQILHRHDLDLRIAKLDLGKVPEHEFLRKIDKTSFNYTLKFGPEPSVQISERK